MSKKLKIFLIITVILIVSWFVPIVPFVSWHISEIPGCETLVLKTSKSLITKQSNQWSNNQFYHHDRVLIKSWGDCAYY